MTQALLIRFANTNDYVVLGELMYDAARNGASLYSEEQRHAWVPHPRHGAQWDQRLSSQLILVAVETALDEAPLRAEDSAQILGFVSLAEKGYIDFAYVRPTAQRRGIFRQLYVAIEKLAIAQGETQLWVHASLLAQRAFASVGFSIVCREAVTIRGKVLERFEMRKVIEEPESETTRT